MFGGDGKAGYLYVGWASHRRVGGKKVIGIVGASGVNPSRSGFGNGVSRLGKLVERIASCLGDWW